MSKDKKPEENPAQESAGALAAVVHPKELAETLADNLKPEIKTVTRGTDESAEVLLVPDSMRVESVKKYVDENRLKPLRREGVIKTTRVQSFINVVKRFKNDASALFADVTVEDKKIDAKITAIFDYHPEGGEVEKAENLGHKAEYNFPVSKAFRNWLDSNTTAMTQINFAFFLEKRLADIVTPDDDDKRRIEGLKPKFADAVDMLTLARELEIYSSETFISKNRTSSGETEFKFSNQHNDANGKPVSIPDFFVIKVPVFEGGDPERILAHLRYRKDGAAMVWYYELYNIDEMLHAAFDNACDTVEKEIGAPLYHGKAEK